MKIIDFLLDSDPAVHRMTKIHLLDEPCPYTADGWIDEFLSRFDAETNTWGGGIYGPKWTSTFYTMRDLKSLEIDPEHPVYHQGLKTLTSRMWDLESSREDDVCVVAMLVSLLGYGRYSASVIEEMIDYLCNHQKPDGGWNCDGSSSKSSIHTTLSVLEAYADYDKEGYRYGLSLMQPQAQTGQSYLLRRNLMRRESTHEVILPYIVDFHFPTRWKYDVLRALTYFASIKHPFEPAFAEGLELLKQKFKNGYLTKGTTYTGRLHFQMEQGKAGAMNTLRGLMVLKHFDEGFYNEIISKEINVP